MSDAEPIEKRFSVVSAVYNVGRYLDDFIASIERQSIDHRHLEVIAVDDGSTDDSLDRLRAWSRRSPELVTVLSQENAGQAAARNTGLDRARGRWVTFVDPDDWVSDDYFEVVTNFIDAHPEVELVATNRVIFDEADQTVRHRHPLRKLFWADVMVDLDALPEYVVNATNAAFVKRARLVDLRLRFDSRVRPNFEDGHFLNRYLLAAERRHVGFLRSAQYLYRKRADESSALQRGARDHRFLTDVPRYGYLDLLEIAVARYGSAPVWLQHLILYELSWYFSKWESGETESLGVGSNEGAEFAELLRQIVQHLDDEVVRRFAVRRYKQVWREIVRFGFRGEPWHTDYVVASMSPQDCEEVELRVRWVGVPPSIRCFVNGEPAEVLRTAVEPLEYYGQQFLSESVVRIRGVGGIRVHLDGTPALLRYRWLNDSQRDYLHTDELLAQASPGGELPPTSNLPAEARPYRAGVVRRIVRGPVRWWRRRLERRGLSASSE